MSSASFSGISHFIFGMWAVVFLNIPKKPLSKFEKPLCSLFSVSDLRILNASFGWLFAPNPKAISTKIEPSSVRPDFSLILSATLLVASNTA
jgi:hypothetical protein